jgi:hypothetical protein
MGRSLRVLRRNVFSYFQLGAFLHNSDGNKKKE